MLVALDVSPDVAAEAAETGPTLIVSHHPVMNIRWHAQQMQTAREDTRLGGLLTELVKRYLRRVYAHQSDGGGRCQRLSGLHAGSAGYKPLNEEKIGRIGTLSVKNPLNSSYQMW